MSSIRRLSLLALVACAACKKDAPPPPPPVDALPPAPVDAGVAAAAAEPALPELPPAEPIPTAPAHLPPVEDSAENPTTPEKVALGHILFFDKRLSKDDSMQCESCHHLANGWTSGQPLDAKVGGALNKRNAPTMLNLAYHSSWYWDGRAPTLEAVSAAAWKGQLGADPAEVAAKLNKIPTYKAHFKRAFNEDASAENVPKALAAFFRTLKSGNSPWDKFEAGDAAAVSKEAKAGFEVFKKAQCTLCHVPPLFSDFQFHNVGIGFDAPEDKLDKGREDSTKDEKDRGMFKTPSMRDVAQTGPYFHDGSVATLEEAIELMVAGGKKNPKLDVRLKPQKLSKKDKANLKAFLESLSGVPTFAGFPTQPE
jgi:cytochrome c peroxidase